MQPQKIFSIIQQTNRELQARGYMVRFVVIAVMSEVMLALMLAVVYTHRQIFW